MSAQQAHTTRAKPAAKTARLRPVRISKRWYTIIVVAAVCAVVVYLGTNVRFGVFQAQSIAEPSAPISDPKEIRTGKIVLQTDPDQCAQMKFDNTDGRLIENLKPCEKDLRFDERGRAMPMGTVHRLDAISKSFFGN
ncbi:MAG: hypothetical protein WBF03_16255 [Xanthobacteraceae bacterium]